MSVDYTFEVESPFRRHALEKVVSAFGLQRTELDHDVWLGSSLSVSIGLPPKGSSRFLDSFDFEPKLWMYFNVDKFNYDVSVTAMVSIVGSALAAFADDAVLIENHDTPVLHRRSGTLMLNDSGGFWDNNGLSLLQLILPPYQFVSLPVF